MDIAYIIFVIIKASFFVWFVFLFYISLQKCFLKEGKSKLKLFLLSLFTSPLISFVEAYGLSDEMVRIILAWSSEPDKNRGLLTMGEIVYDCIAIGIIYLILILLYSWLAGKWLRAETRQSVLFVYLMFNTISILSNRGTGGSEFFSSRNAAMILDEVGVLVLYLAAGLFYRLVICPLSEMTWERINVNWKIFIVPPAIFAVFYIMSIPIMVDKHESLGGKLLITFYLFSSVIVFLFIWAFHVIIKNIIATNEAVKAQEEAEKAKDEVKTLSVEVMEALAHTIDAKDEYTRGHSVRVANYSRMIADKMGMSPEDSENVYYMGLLHDLGKIGVPNEIINSPTKLTDEQYAVIKTHPGLGFDILSEIKSRPDLVIGARWHHERYDGKGYPDGKSGEDIPIMARIIAVADSYDAMTSNRSYRKYMPQDKVRSEIEKNMGTQFDPKVAECMLRIIGEDVSYELHE